MLKQSKKMIVAIAAALFLSGLMTSAASASRYGPAGLGSNLHRRFVIKQAAKRTARGQVVRNRAILWLSYPSSRGYIRTRSRW